MPTYLSVLGREPELSIAEFLAVLQQHNITYSNPVRKGEYFFINSQDDFSCAELLKQLGGTVLLAKKYDASPTETSLADLLESLVSVGKITFSLHTKRHATPLALSVKKELKSRGRAVRYVAPKNTATIIHNNLDTGRGDIYIVEEVVYVTQAVQDIEGFSHRDYERPRVDTRSGMLPPKLSRIMINLAGGKQISSLHDPFCGSGTVLMEAVDLGIAQVSGSDLSEKAVDDTKENLQWLSNQPRENTPTSWVKKIDATTLSSHITAESIQAIVTEPYMGTPLRGRESLSLLQKQANELKRLYRNVLIELHTVLKTNGVVVMIFPSFYWNDTWIHTIDKDALAPYFSIELQQGKPFLRYHRNDQHLARDIWVLRKI